MATKLHNNVVQDFFGPTSLILNFKKNCKNWSKFMNFHLVTTEWIRNKRFWFFSRYHSWTLKIRDCIQWIVCCSTKCPILSCNLHQIRHEISLKWKIHEAECSSTYNLALVLWLLRPCGLIAYIRSWIRHISHEKQDRAWVEKWRIICNNHSLLPDKCVLCSNVFIQLVENLKNLTKRKNTNSKCDNKLNIFFARYWSLVKKKSAQMY